METGYLVVAKDGKEYGPLDRDTIQRWYTKAGSIRTRKCTSPASTASYRSVGADSDSLLHALDQPYEPASVRRE